MLLVSRCNCPGFKVVALPSFHNAKMTGFILSFEKELVEEYLITSSDRRV